MKKLNLHDIYNVGKHLNPLANIEENAKVRTSTINSLDGEKLCDRNDA